MRVSSKFVQHRLNAGAIRRLAAALVGAALLWTAVMSTASADTVADTEPELSRAEATASVLEYPKVTGWLERFPEDKLLTSATFSEESGQWEVGVFSGEAGQLVDARVDDRSGAIVTVWVGPEVAWPLARGSGLGGVINRPTLWLAFCAFFLIGLADLRRPLCLRNLDLLGLLSFSAYLVFLNQGRVFAADLAAAASLTYLMGRALWIGVTNRPLRSPSFQAPVWLLVAGLVFLAGLRVGLNTEASGVLDVGYAGVIGADRLVHAESPYGNFPQSDTGVPCGQPNSEGQVADWVQENGRCETANHLGDTYGPVNYLAYIPGLWLFGWSGKWDYLPAVHLTTILFDLLAMLGLAAVGYRFGRTRLAVTLAFAWAAYPFTQYVSSSNTNDSIMAALLIWGFWAATSPAGRGALLALASWTKFAALIVVPLWASYPNARTRRSLWRFITAFGITTLLAFWVLFVTGDPLHEIRTFYERTFQIQFDRSSPFSLWDWGQYHAAGLPDLKWLQHLLQVVLVAGAVTLAVVPRRKTPLQLAAFTAALIMAFEFLLTHWAALYIVWFLPFSFLITLAGDALRDVPITAEPEGDRQVPPSTNDGPGRRSATPQRHEAV
jgi:hypothetical protein